MPISIFQFGKASVSIKDAEGKEYRLSPLGFKEISEYVLAYKYKEVEEAKFATKDFTPTARQQEIDKVYAECKAKRWTYMDKDSGEEKVTELSWEAPEVQESCNSIWGISEQLYLAIRMNHARITREQASALINLHSYSLILNKLMVVNGFTEEESTGEEDEDLGLKIHNQ